MKESQNRIYLCNVKRYGEGGKHMTKKRNIGMLILMGIVMVLKPVYDFRIGRRGWNEVPARDGY